PVGEPAKPGCHVPGVSAAGPAPIAARSATPDTKDLLPLLQLADCRQLRPYPGPALGRQHRRTRARRGVMETYVGSLSRAPGTPRLAAGHRHWPGGKAGYHPVSGDGSQGFGTENFKALFEAIERSGPSAAARDPRVAIADPAPARGTLIRSRE